MGDRGLAEKCAAIHVQDQNYLQHTLLSLSPSDSPEISNNSVKLREIVESDLVSLPVPLHRLTRN